MTGGEDSHAAAQIRGGRPFRKWRRRSSRWPILKSTGRAQRLELARHNAWRAPHRSCSMYAGHHRDRASTPRAGRPARHLRLGADSPVASTSSRTRARVFGRHRTRPAITPTRWPAKLRHASATATTLNHQSVLRSGDARADALVGLPSRISAAVRPGWRLAGDAGDVVFLQLPLPLR